MREYRNDLIHRGVILRPVEDSRTRHGAIRVLRNRESNVPGCEIRVGVESRSIKSRGTSQPRVAILGILIMI